MIDFAVVLAALMALQPATASDPRASDAVAIFGNLCVGTVAGVSPPFDPTRFAMTEITPEHAREIRPDVRADHLWDVSGANSGVHTLLHYEPQVGCVLDVAEADETSVRGSFERLVQETAAKLRTTAERRPDRRETLDGKEMTFSSWTLKSPKGQIMLAITTYPDAKYMIQHMMTVSYVK